MNKPLCIDGLDRVIADNDAYWLSLAALLRVADQLHTRLFSAKAKIWLLVMCRSDVFRKIRTADADKIAGDSTLFMDWGASDNKPDESPLWDYLAHKANITIQELIDFFVQQVEVGSSTHPTYIPLQQYLIESTRSTPREINLLMKQIQLQSSPGVKITSRQIRRAADNFATRDMLTAVTAESTGLISTQLANHLNEILARLPRSQGLTPNEIRCAVRDEGLDENLTQEFCQFLFLAGLLGNYDPRSQYVQFYHRRDTVQFKANGPWVLHRGLMRAFNIPFL